eukprot:2947034-Pyramimonas_sp.AAC.1
MGHRIVDLILVFQTLYCCRLSCVYAPASLPPPINPPPVTSTALLLETKRRAPLSLTLAFPPAPQLSGRCAGAVCQQWQYLLSAVTGVLSACAAICAALAVVLGHDRSEKETESELAAATTTLVHQGGWLKLKPLSLQR